MTSNQRAYNKIMRKIQPKIGRWIGYGLEHGLEFDTGEIQALFEKPKRITKQFLKDLKHIPKKRYEFYEKYATQEGTKTPYERPKEEIREYRRRAEKARLTREKKRILQEAKNDYWREVRERELEEETTPLSDEDFTPDKEDFTPRVYGDYDETVPFQRAYFYGENLIQEFANADDVHAGVSEILRDLILTFVNNAEDESAERFCDNYERNKEEIEEAILKALNYETDGNNRGEHIASQKSSLFRALDLLFDGTGYYWQGEFGERLESAYADMHNMFTEYYNYRKKGALY